MATMHISLPDAMKEFVEAEAARGGFGSVSEYFRSVIGEVQKRKARQGLEEKLLEGLRSPAREMTEADWVALRREVLQRSPELRDGE